MTLARQIIEGETAKDFMARIDWKGQFIEKMNELGWEGGRWAHVRGYFKFRRRVYFLGRIQPAEIGVTVIAERPDLLQTVSFYASFYGNIEVYKIKTSQFLGVLGMLNKRLVSEPPTTDDEERRLPTELQMYRHMHWLHKQLIMRKELQQEAEESPKDFLARRNIMSPVARLKAAGFIHLPRADRVLAFKLSHYIHLYGRFVVYAKFWIKQGTEVAFDVEIHDNSAVSNLVQDGGSTKLMIYLKKIDLNKLIGLLIQFKESLTTDSSAQDQPDVRDYVRIFNTLGYNLAKVAYDPGDAAMFLHLKGAGFEL